MDRALFRISVTQDFFAANDAERAKALEAIPAAFERLGERFGITVLGTFDDDLLTVGPSPEPMAYILAELPDPQAAVRICELARDTSVGEYRLWRYLRIEAKLGRELFFGKR